MAFDLQGLADAVAQHGSVARVVIAGFAGSSPRELGADMLVWATGQSGSIGGGALEFAATARAREGLQLGAKGDWFARYALGPDMGQCCGGAVSLLCEVFDAARLDELERGGLNETLGLFARPLPHTGAKTQANIGANIAAHSLGLARLFDRARAQGVSPQPQICDNWMVEPLLRPGQPLWLWGAGHVGRALVAILAPLPDIALTWVDTSAARFPADIPAQVVALPAALPERLVPHAPQAAQHIIMTYSHQLDLALCDGLLRHGAADIGLIGSASKWARFRKRLQAMGHSTAAISRITCPIGTPSLGKHPQSIAIGVAAAVVHNTKRVSSGERVATG